MRSNLSKQRAMQMLGWDELQYATYQEEAGIKWLERYPYARTFVPRIIKTELFWQFWRTNWAVRDEEFCEYAGMLKSDKEAREMYNIIHDVRNINLRMPRQIFSGKKGIWSTYIQPK